MEKNYNRIRWWEGSGFEWRSSTQHKGIDGIELRWERALLPRPEQFEVGVAEELLEQRRRSCDAVVLIVEHKTPLADVLLDADIACSRRCRIVTVMLMVLTIGNIN